MDPFSPGAGGVHWRAAGDGAMRRRTVVYTTRMRGGADSELGGRRPAAGAAATTRSTAPPSSPATGAAARSAAGRRRRSTPTGRRLASKPAMAIARKEGGMLMAAKGSFPGPRGARVSTLELAETLYKTPALVAHTVRCGKPACRCADGAWAWAVLVPVLARGRHPAAPLRQADRAGRGPGGDRAEPRRRPRRARRPRPQRCATSRRSTDG